MVCLLQLLLLLRHFVVTHVSSVTFVTCVTFVTNVTAVTFRTIITAVMSVTYVTLIGLNGLMLTVPMSPFYQHSAPSFFLGYSFVWG